MEIDIATSGYIRQKIKKGKKRRWRKKYIIIWADDFKKFIGEKDENRTNTRKDKI